ncbi:MAG TPA: hypothetical protein VFZ34_24735 [Blastocatellia bacterium]|nr:hypothetical protein [Blastocatellia bacterium]
MIRNIINAITTATRAFFGNWKTAVIFVLLYAVFVFAVYLFFTTPEARMWQVALTVLLLLVIPVLFFVLQTMGVEYVNGERKFSELLARAGREFWKPLLVSLPVMALTWLAIWGLNTLDHTMTAGIRDAASSAGTDAAFKAGEERIKTLALTITVVSALILYFIVPLFSIHLWIAAVRDGIKQTLKGILRVLLRAFAPRSVLTYLLGFVVFGVLPYYILTMRTPIKSPWLDLTLLGARIALALLVVLMGWVVTVGALSILQSTATTGSTGHTGIATENA